MIIKKSNEIKLDNKNLSKESTVDIKNRKQEAASYKVKTNTITTF